MNVCNKKISEMTGPTITINQDPPWLRGLKVSDVLKRRRQDRKKSDESNRK